MGMSRTGLSIGLAIRKALVEDEDVMAIAKRVYPVLAENEAAELPYICYRRTSNEQIATKSLNGAETVNIQIVCYAATYEQAVNLGEAVRKCLDYRKIEYKETDSDTGEEVTTLNLKSITFTDAEEDWEDDAYLQGLSFQIKVN